MGHLPGFDFMPEPVYSYATRWLTAVLIDPDVSGTSRDAVIQALAARNIEARPLWKPMHQQPLFAGCRHRSIGVADQLFDTGVCLPSGSNLTEDQIALICEVIQSTIRS